MKNKTIEILSQAYPFNKLSEAVVKKIVDTANYKTYNEQEFVFKSKEPLNEVYIVIEGMAMAILTMSDGEETVVEFFRTGSFFGEAAAMASSVPPISVQAVQPLTCLVFNREQFSTLIHENPEFAEEMTRTISERLLKIYRELHEEISQHKQGVETLPFRKKIGEFMTAPVKVCAPSTPIIDIAKLFYEHKISSVVVVKVTDGTPMGIVTESDLIKKVIAQGKEIKGITAIEIMGHPLHTIKADNLYYDALLKMVQNHIKHLIVVEHDKLIGMVTVKDLMKARSVGTLSVVDSIEKQDTIEGLKSAQNEIDNVLEALLNEYAPAFEISTIITEFNDRLIRKVIKITEQEMVNEGHGQVPVEYCWLQLGPSGRKEQLLRTSQNNAIIYADPVTGKVKAIESWFKTFADKAVNNINECGFNYSNQGINANKEPWLQTYKQWLCTIDTWLKAKDEATLTKSMYLQDMRYLYGKRRLAEDVKYYMLDASRPATMYLHRLTQLELDRKVPLGILSEIITPESGVEKGMFNVRYDGYLHITDCVRLYGLRYGAEKLSTFEKIDELVDLGHFSRFEAKKYREAYETLLRISLDANVRKLKKNKKADHLVNPQQMNQDDLDSLKDALTITQQLQEKVKVFLKK